MTTTFRNFTINYSDEDELQTLIDEIWKKRTYYVDLPTNTPVIIDAGAHIGLATLYFHSLYPRAQITCIEPNPQNVELLKQNLTVNLIENVTIIPKALSGDTGTTTLFANPKWSVYSSLKKGGWTGEEPGYGVVVETTTLSSLINSHVDLLKMDIEGSETEVLREAQNKLKFVDHLILEFHKTQGQSEELVLKILRNFYKEINVIVDERREHNRHNQLLLIEASK